MYSLRDISLLTALAVIFNYMSAKLGIDILMPFSFLVSGIALYLSIRTKVVDRRVNMIFICFNGVYFLIVGSVYVLIPIFAHYADQLPYTW